MSRVETAKLFVAVAYTFISPLAGATDGLMSMWASTSDTIDNLVGCKFADGKMGGVNAPTAKTPYIQQKHYCGVSLEMFKAGAVCGACYHIKYNGNEQEGLGRPGSLTIQVVDTGSWATFDCHMSAFHTITGDTKSIFPITYEKVPCETSTDGATAAVLSYDYHWTKFVFSDMKYPVESAELSVGDRSYRLERVYGYWAAWTGPVNGDVDFNIVDDHGNKASLHACFSGWKNRQTGSACAEGTRRSSIVPASSQNLRGTMNLLASQQTSDPEPEPSADSSSASSAAPEVPTANKEKPLLKHLRNKLTDVIHLFLAATGRIEHQAISRVTNTSQPAPVIGLARLASDMEAQIVDTVPKLVARVNEYASTGRTSRSELTSVVAKLRSTMQETDLPKFVSFTSALIGHPAANVSNSSVKDFVYEISRLLTDYITNGGNTTAHPTNPEGCVDSISHSLKSMVDFQLQAHYADVDCDMADSAKDCVADAVLVLAKYATLTRSVALSAFECGGIVDTCTQEIANTLSSLLNGMTTVMLAEENCADAGNQFFLNWCETELLDAVDKSRHLAEDLGGVTQVCKMNPAEASNLSAAIVELGQNNGASLSDAILP